MSASDQTPESHKGVMDASYADGRESKRHLVYRYKVRAQVAISGYQRYFPQQPPSRVLEMGAAEGKTLLEMRRITEEKGEYIGVELADSLLARAPQMPEGASLIQGNVMDLPESLAPNSFDLCVALAVLEHLPDPLACVREAFRILKPGGIFVATCPHPFWDDIAGNFGLVAEEHHEGKMTLEKLRILAKAGRFGHVEAEPFMWVPTGFLPYIGPSLSPKMSLLVDGWVRKLQPLHFSFVNQVVYAQKPHDIAE